MEQLLDIDWEALHEILTGNIVVQILLTVITTLLIQITINYLIGAFARNVVRRNRYASRKVDARKQEQTLYGILSTSIGVVIWTVAVLIVLTQLGFQLSMLLTGAGLLGVVFGFGAQSVIRDFVAGLFILGENQYRVGDVIKLQVGGVQVSGTVEEVTVRITRLRDLDGNLHIVSNGTPQSVTNLSYKYANVNIDVEVAYDTDIDKLQQVINDTGQQIARSDKWSRSISEPIQFLRIDGFTASGMRIKSLGRVKPAEQWAVAGEFRRRLKEEFDKREIRFSGDDSHEDT